MTNLSGLPPPFDRTQLVKSTAFADRVADLYQEDPKGPIIGYEPKLVNNENQQWLFIPQGNSNHCKIRTSGAIQGPTGVVRVPTYVYSPNAIPDQTLAATTDEAEATIFRIILVGAEKWRILYEDSELCWTLSDHAEGTAITLQPSTGDPTQDWLLNPAT